MISTLKITQVASPMQLEETVCNVGFFAWSLSMLREELYVADVVVGKSSCFRLAVWRSTFWRVDTASSPLGTKTMCI